MGPISADRLERERDFHNERFAQGTRIAQDKYYFAIAPDQRRFERMIEEHSEGADIFELGCAQGENVFQIKAKFKSASGIDISDYAIQQANAIAARASRDNVVFLCGDAEHIDTPDASYDFVYGSGIVHHLDTERCAREVARLLRPGGVAIFWEPLGHNFAVNLYRRLTPDARTVDEHPLLRHDFDVLKRYFDVEIEFIGLATLLAVPFHNMPALRWTRSVAAAVDRVLLKLPGLRWQAWYSISTLRKRTG